MVLVIFANQPISLGSPLVFPGSEIWAGPGLEFPLVFPGFGTRGNLRILVSKSYKYIGISSTVGVRTSWWILEVR